MSFENSNSYWQSQKIRQRHWSNGVIQDKRRGHQYERKIICHFSGVLMSVKSFFHLHSCFGAVPDFGAMVSCPVCLDLPPPLIPVSLKLDIHHKSNPFGGQTCSIFSS
ncbi:hypothetical protein AVEN_152130-1 [Araneus ventricosus]|uniref:Uncharacterized protein n=1 Tax=Araneus ventricosus TaxID=182803 RepID=A0A4Y2IVH6_ARAVE|nr:hypothetical protein AVEN_152130-1 [Araneus ventricosus]